ncbi:MAG: glycosyltransferase family 2 protein [Polaribacter sp.]|nr:glycosyltransferase family 2 protein [Polaribacter sp.]
MNKTAVLLTCFNRKKHTLTCLNRLFFLSQEIDVYVVDDNSSDGTSAAILKKYPDVHIIKGNGDLFWSRGMHLAWEHASKHKYDFYLWLNDDVILYENCFDELYACTNILSCKGIVSGIIETADKSKIIYGGTDKQRNIIKPNGHLQQITNMNGNVVLIPSAVFEKLGNLDPTFHHDLGDVDYGYRTQKEGFSVCSTRVVVGSGQVNDLCRMRVKNCTLKERFQKLYSPLGSPPKLNFYFRKRHFGFLNAFSFYAFQLVLNTLPDSLVKFIFGNKYFS